MKAFHRVIRMALATLLAAAATASQAQTYPSRPVRYLIPLPAGGAVDIVARTTGTAVTERTRMQFIYENRPGANTTLSTDACAKAPPDGYTVCLLTSSFSLNQFLYSKLPFDPVKDIEPITILVFNHEALLLNPSVPAGNIPELVAYAKANPGKINFGSVGTGSSTHLVPEWVSRQTGASFTHIPYKGIGEVVQAFMAGDIHMMFSSLGNPAFIANIKSGKMKALFVQSSRRVPVIPDVPTMAEAGVTDHGYRSWWGLAAPARTPRDIIQRLNADFAEALRASAVRERFAALSVEPVGNTPEEFARFMAEDRAGAERLVKASGARLD